MPSPHIKSKHPPHNQHTTKRGYQGSERDDDVKGEGNSHTTFYRMHDPRLGRWFSIDPKATTWESPYVSMGNNPVWRNDIFGDVFDETSKTTISNHKENTHNRIDAINSEIKRIENGIKLLTENNYNHEMANSITDPDNKLEELKNTVAELNNAITEIEELERSNQVYSLKNLNSAPNNNIQGMTYHENGIIVSEFSSEESLAHELTHMYQFEKRKISFSIENRASGFLHDVTDEIEAYTRGSYYSGNLLTRNLTAKQIICSDPSYFNLSKDPLDSKSTLYDVFKHIERKKNYMDNHENREKWTNTQFEESNFDYIKR
jgi:RHS repeat-associated protein